MEVERCQEAIASLLLDAGQPVTYRTLSAATGAKGCVAQAALAAFAKEHADQVNGLVAVIQKDTTQQDARARKISLRPMASTEAKDTNVLCTQLIGLFPMQSSENDAKNTNDSDVVTTMATAFWAQERKCRNDEFDRIGKKNVLSKALKAIYASDIHCNEATTKQQMEEPQGEEAISVFDSIKTASKPKASTFFNSSHSSKARSSATTTKCTTTTSKPTMNHSNNGVQKIDSDAMSKVLTVDSDEDSDNDDECPVFVKKATSQGGRKRVISDDEDEDEEDQVCIVEPMKPAAASRPSSKKQTTKPRNVKRKLSDAEPEPMEVIDQPQEAQEAEEEIVQDEPAEIPTKRRILVTKTRINEQGYMVSEQVYEDVELTSTEIAQEKQKQQQQQQRKQQAMKQQQAAKAKKASSSSANGPVKQKSMFDFFRRS